MTEVDLTDLEMAEMGMEEWARLLEDEDDERDAEKTLALYREKGLDGFLKLEEL